jgi:predicted Rdx family selenoprotein
VFDVVVDGRLIFSKHQAGRFPTEDEILDQLPEGP